MSIPIITTSSKDYIPPTSALLATAFATDPVITYLLHSLPPTTRTPYLPSYFSTLLTAATLNGGSIDAAGGWESCGVLMPPGSRVDNPWTLAAAGFVGMMWVVGVGGCMRMLFEFTPLADAAKAKGLKGRKRYYYVFFLGTDPSARRRGLCSLLVRDYQARARLEGVPLWLEATTAYSKRLYESLGFEVVEEMVLGKGKVDANGVKCKDGEGVKFWGMIWEFREGKDLPASSDPSPL